VSEYAFMSGLPRTGTTLLSVLLRQNPAMYLSHESSVADHARYLHQAIPGKEDVRLGTNKERHEALFRAVLPSYYADVTADYVIDKARMWGMPYYIRILNEMLGQKPKIIVPVRPLAEVITSILLHLQRNPVDNFVDRQMLGDDFFPYWRKDLDDARVDYLLRPGAMIDAGMLAIHTAMKDESEAEFLFVTYDEIVTDTQEALDRIHSFLGAPSFSYDVTELSNTMWQNDMEVLGLPGFHDVRPVLSRTSVAPEMVLSDYALERCRLEDFWTERVHEYAVS